MPRSVLEAAAEGVLLGLLADVARLGQGFGTLLMEEAERIAREEHGSVKLAVISGKLHLSCDSPSGV